MTSTANGHPTVVFAIITNDDNQGCPILQILSRCKPSDTSLSRRPGHICAKLIILREVNLTTLRRHPRWTPLKGYRGLSPPKAVIQHEIRYSLPQPPTISHLSNMGASQQIEQSLMRSQRNAWRKSKSRGQTDQNLRTDTLST